MVGPLWVRYIWCKGELAIQVATRGVGGRGWEGLGQQAEKRGRMDMRDLTVS